jgi:23S rRNA pseudouridine955/2504/2580 synthase
MTQVQLIQVEADDDDTRLDRWFRRRFPNVTNGKLQKWCRTGSLRVDGKRVDGATRVAAGQTVRVPPLVGLEERSKKAIPVITDHDAEDLRARVLFKDDWVIVIDKPFGLAVQGGTGTTRHLDGMLNALAFDGDRPKLVHRLDRDTSGVLILARTVLSARRLGETFRGKAARKYYWGITVGVPDEKRGRIDGALLKREGTRGEKVELDEEDGRPAVSLFSVIDNAANKAAWVALWPLTGRTHQLRAHMALIGKPILGDGKYGGAAAHLNSDEIDQGLHLHARRLILPHPSGKGMIDVTAPLPVHMRETWKYFGFDAKNDGDPFREIAS